MGLVIPESAERWLNVQRSQAKTVDEYITSVEEDFEIIKPYLLEGDVLEIGCGLGALSVLLSRHCGGKVWMLDGTGDCRSLVHKGPTCEPYNDMEVTRELIEANGVTDYEFLPIGCEDLPEVDTCVSLISWGWHYPLSAYQPKAKVIIADIRYEDVTPKEVISKDCTCVRGKGARVVL